MLVCIEGENDFILVTEDLERPSVARAALVDGDDAIGGALRGPHPRQSDAYCQGDSYLVTCCELIESVLRIDRQDRVELDLIVAGRGGDADGPDLEKDIARVGRQLGRLPEEPQPGIIKGPPQPTKYKGF